MIPEVWAIPASDHGPGSRSDSSSSASSSSSSSIEVRLVEQLHRPEASRSCERGLRDIGPIPASSASKNRRENARLTVTSLPGCGPSAATRTSSRAADAVQLERVPGDRRDDALRRRPSSRRAALPPRTADMRHRPRDALRDRSGSRPRRADRRARERHQRGRSDLADRARDLAPDLGGLGEQQIDHRLRAVLGAQQRRARARSRGAGTPCCSRSPSMQRRRGRVAELHRLAEHAHRLGAAHLL